MQPSTERKPDWAWDVVSIVDNNEKSNNYCQHVLRTCYELDTESHALHRLPHSIFPVILWDRSVSSLDLDKQDSCPSPVPLGYFQSSAVNFGLTRSSKELQHSRLWGFPGAPQIDINSSGSLLPVTRHPLNRILWYWMATMTLTCWFLATQIVYIDRSPTKQRFP